VGNEQCENYPDAEVISELLKRHADALFNVHEVASDTTEKRTGFTRKKMIAECPRCKGACQVRLMELHLAEGGFITYSPTRVIEWAACPLCELTDIHEFVHRAGVPRKT
jgi:hypothetical protein